MLVILFSLCWIGCVVVGNDMHEMDGSKVCNKVLWRFVDDQWSFGISLCLIAFEVTQNMCCTLIFVFWKCFCEVVGPKQCVYEALDAEWWFYSVRLSILSVFLGLSVIARSKVMIHVWYSCCYISWWVYVMIWYIRMMSGGMFDHVMRCCMYVYTYMMG